MCDNKDFVHLHNHTNMSIQDALPWSKEMALHARKMGFPAVAITEHGNMNGTIDFLEGCRMPSEDLPPIKPIVGVEAYTCKDRNKKESMVVDENGVEVEVNEEAYDDDGDGEEVSSPVVPQDTGKKKDKKRRPKHPHILLLAENETGYRNLTQACSVASEEGFYYEPRMDREVLERFSEGVIVGSGCLGGEVCQALLHDDFHAAEESAIWYKEHFPGRYYIEFQHHRIPEQATVLKPLWQLAKKLDLPVIASNDIHYLSKEDWSIHKVLISMRDINDKDKVVGGKFEAYKTKQFYMKSADEMMAAFNGAPEEAVKRMFRGTMEIAERVEDYTKSVIDVPHLLPSARIPMEDERFIRFWQRNMKYNHVNEAYLAYLAVTGLRKMGKADDKEYVKRLKTELNQIFYMGVTDYFLIQGEFSAFMNEKNIFFGLRGSGVGSLVLRAMEVSRVDPLEWGLIFERFLNPGRGTQYKVDLSCLPVKAWQQSSSATSPDDALVKLKTALKVTEDAHPEHGPDMHKELWVLENQGVAAYITDVADKGLKTEDNECQLWAAYALGITAKEPDSGMVVSRVAGLPDVDTDIETRRREEVIQWVSERFGHEYVSRIGTVNTFRAKAAVTCALKTSEDFQAAYGGDKGAIHQAALIISGSIPNRQNPPMTIDDAISLTADKPGGFAEWAKQFPQEIENARRLMGVPQNLGIHPAGIVVGSEPIARHAPLVNNKGILATGYNMGSVERVGLVKYDFLGLAGYEEISRCFELIALRDGGDKTPTLEDIPLEDPKVLNLYRQGQTATVFQFSGPGMQKSLREVRVDRIDDLIAVVALYRPGPMEYIPAYAHGKHHPDSITYKHPVLKKILGPTHGIVVFQEQLMNLFREMGGYSWQEVDKVRKAVSKKLGADFEKACKALRERSLANGFSEETIQEVLHLIEAFGGYAFNRAHACSYALLSYWMAYLRIYYPSQWLAACIEVEHNDEEKMAIYKRECRDLRIAVKRPTVNEGRMETSVNARDEILMSLTTIKGVGEAARPLMTCERPFADVKDLCFRGRLNKGLIKAFAEGGALDCFPEIRKLGANTEAIMEYYDEMVALRTKADKAEAAVRKAKYVVYSPLANKGTQADIQVGAEKNANVTKRLSGLFGASGDLL